MNLCQNVKKKSPQFVCFPLGTVVTPSHVVLQLVSFPIDVLIVFPGQMEHVTPSRKYPALQTKRKEIKKLRENFSNNNNI